MENIIIDLHCHILPNVDDGAESLDEALEMAQMAADSGVTAIVATPHCNLPNAQRNNYISSDFKQNFLRLLTGINQAGISLRILPGAEVFCTPEIPELLRKGKLPTLANSNYLLVEFFFDENLNYMDDMLSAIAAEGITPVIAHPERYEAIQHTPDIIERWFWNHYVIQLNKGSILGRLGRRAARTADWILSRGLAHVVASDAHSSRVRTTQMTELNHYLSEICTPEYTEILLTGNPSRIIENKPIIQVY